MTSTSEVRIELEVRLRPTRFGFLTPVGSANSVRRVIGVNTVLWGGRFNPFLPLFLRRPRWFEGPEITGLQITEGLIEGFQPDFLVWFDKTHAEKAGWASRRHFGFDSLFNPEGEDPLSSGTDVLAVYQELYETRFQFQQREPREVVIPRSSSGDADLVAGATFGRFPDDGSLTVFEDAFRTAFSARDIEVTPDNLYPLLDKLYPLNMGSNGLRTTGEIGRAHV